MKIYHVETKEAYDALMSELEEKGCKWRSGEKLTDIDEFSTHGKDTYVYEECCRISISSVNFLKAYHSDKTPIEFKAKGENMTQEEMKYNLQEIESDLKEAKTSAKKLIEKIDEYLESQKPKFEVGDYVTVYVNGIKKIAKIDALRENKEEAHGLWYDETKVNVKQDYWFLAELNEFRHARPSEIAEYKAALTFYKRGRKPFEVRIGDLIHNKSDGKNFLVKGDTIFLRKQDFIDGKLFFLKTYKEVNECLENK